MSHVEWLTQIPYTGNTEGIFNGLFWQILCAKPIQFLPCQWRRHLAGKPVSFIKLETIDLCHKGLPFIKLGGHKITSCEVLKRCFCWRRHTFYNIYEKWLASLISKILKRLIEAGVNGVNRLATNGKKYYWLPTKRENNYRLGQEKYKPTTDIDRSTFQKEHRQPKRTMCRFGLQRSFGLNILELLVYYLMPNKCKNLKDMKSSTFALSQTGTVDRAKLTTLPRESDVLSIWRGRQAPRFESRNLVGWQPYYASWRGEALARIDAKCSAPRAHVAEF